MAHSGEEERIVTKPTVNRGGGDADYYDGKDS
jgi:hypothetical protein